MVGSAARMRASLVTTPSCTGTFKSSLIRTRLPRRSVSVMRNTFMAFVSGRLRPGDGRVQHAIREAPLVVVPPAHLHQRAVHYLRERGIERGGMRIVVEVHRDERTIVVRKDALEVRRTRGLLHER